MRHIDLKNLAIKSSLMCFFIAFSATSSNAFSQADFVENSEAGFVVAEIAYAVGADASESGSCPEGLTSGYNGVFSNAFVPKIELPRKEGESENAYLMRQFERLRQPGLRSLCQFPELGKPDPNYKTVIGSSSPVDGIDIDKLTPATTGVGTCPHKDFVSPTRESGIDNQFWRLMGCTEAMQSTGQGNDFETEMLTGAWGILITLKGVDDIANDDSLEVGIYANADPIRLSADRKPIPYATYLADQDPRFRATTPGRLKDGVLTIDPVDVRFRSITNSVHQENILRDVVAHMTLSQEGVLEGYLAGYAPVENLYDRSFGFRAGKNRAGEPAEEELIRITGLGKAMVQNYTCEGVYHALLAHADGHPDPESGNCTSISLQYKIKAIPAYVFVE